MVQFKNAQESHEHSLQTLEILYGYDSFLDSLEVVADMGCGRGLDINWWATLETRDDPPEPRNYKCFAVDRNVTRVDPTVAALPNLKVVEQDFENKKLSRKVDLMWSHDSFQYVTNPLHTLKLWNQQMNVNGMLILILPQSTTTEYNRLVARGYNHSYFNHNLVSLIYMLSVNGFDCKDAYALKQENDPWLHIAAYKSDIEPMDPATTSWYDLAEKGLLNTSVENSLNKFGYVRQEDIIYPWLDKDFYRVTN